MTATAKSAGLAGFERLLEELFSEPPVTFAEFLSCLSSVSSRVPPSELQSHVERLFKLYSQMCYVVPRNTRDECLLEVVPRLELSSLWSSIDGEGIKSGDEGGTEMEGGKEYEKESERQVVRANEMTLSRMREVRDRMRGELEEMERKECEEEGRAREAEEGIREVVGSYALAAQLAERS